MMHLSPDEHTRYTRHLAMPEIGLNGQVKLKNSSVLIVGAGGLGAPIAYYLCAAGVGHIGIMDADIVDESNLQRQIIHSTLDIGRYKALSAEEKLKNLNPNTKITPICEQFDNNNASHIIKPYDFIIDATDNFSSKFLINDECIKANKPFSIGAIYRFEGQTLTHIPGTACYRCIFDSVPDSKATIGPISPIPGIIGSIQATEAIKYIIGSEGLLTNSLLTVNTMTMEFLKLKISPHPNCHCQSPTH